MTPILDFTPETFQEKFQKHLCLQKIHFSEQQGDDDPPD